MADKTDKPEPKKPEPREADAQEQRLHPLLSNEEVLEIRAQARKNLEKERAAAARKALLQEETERLRMEEGMVTGGQGDEMVDITIVLAEHSDKILTNQRAYWHGRTYRVPRHVANSLSEIMFRGYKHQNEIDGKSLTSMYQNARSTVLSPVKGVKNAPQRFDA